MKTTSIEKIKGCQYAVENIRNICILAHVDHGDFYCFNNLLCFY